MHAIIASVLYWACYYALHCAITFYYLRRRLASGEGILSLGICLCVCLSVRPAATARRISLDGEGNALYPVLSSFMHVLLRRNK